MSDVSNEIPSSLIKAYAECQGFAVEFDGRHELHPLAAPYYWLGVRWEVVCHYAMPCCGAKLALVRKAGTFLSEWHGIQCPKQCSTASYVVGVAGRIVR